MFLNSGHGPAERSVNKCGFFLSVILRVLTKLKKIKKHNIFAIKFLTKRLNLCLVMYVVNEQG